MAAVGVEAHDRPKIEVSNFEISLTEINMGAGIIEFVHDNKSGKKRFSFSSMEGEDRMLDETFDLSEFELTKVKSSPVIWLTPHNRDQKSICITFKSRDSYELFLANSSNGGSPKKSKTKSFKQLRKKTRAAKREADTVYEDHFLEENIDESDLQCVKRDDVNILPAYSRSSPTLQDNSTTPDSDDDLSNSDSDKKTSSEEDVAVENRESKEKEEDRVTMEKQERSARPCPLKSDDDLSNSDSDKKTSSEEDGEDEDRRSKEKEEDMVTMEKQERSAEHFPLKSDDDLSNSDSETKKKEIEENEEYNTILKKAGDLAKDRRHVSKKDKSTQSP